MLLPCLMEDSWNLQAIYVNIQLLVTIQTTSLKFKFLLYWPAFGYEDVRYSHNTDFPSF